MVARCGAGDGGDELHTAIAVNPKTAIGFIYVSFFMSLVLFLIGLCGLYQKKAYGL